GIDEADAILLVGTNPRREAPLINARIRKRWLNGGAIPIGVIGEAHDLTYPVAQLGGTPSALRALVDGQGAFVGTLRDAKLPMIVVGQGALARPDGAAVLAAAWALAASVGALSGEWHGFNVLHTAAARVGGMFAGFLPGPGGKGLDAMMGSVDLLWLLGADEFDIASIGAETFVVYQGHHGDRGASRADVILPGAAYTEKNGTYVNTEGRVQRGYLSVSPPGDAKEDWAILRAFSAVVGKTLPYDTIATLRERLVQAHPSFARINHLPRFGCTDHTGPAGDPAALGDAPFVSPVANYYQTDPISRASPTMAECSRVNAATPLLQAAE
ncbi:MAG TPA: molybdopterin-dependent oxidoreductase, partial [Acidisphaera sp.]|nr:molybdopterin-dependent oxidoreductase [Acidisphaera sp.]